MQEVEFEEKSTEQTNENNAGIVAMECYFPKLYISQSEYEQYNNVSAGKYTIGLGQHEMSFTTDREDICSISLTVLSSLIRKNNIDYNDIGWICVATETIIDHSKSISSMLMQLFKDNGNHHIEGIDVKHACYAGTFALFSAFDRISSKYWDGKYCVVITADIAEYEEGPARCTGGCGAVALLIGKNGCIDLNIPRATYKAHEYDFYKPHLNSPYPVVNGHVSNKCYLNALDCCMKSYKSKQGQQWRPVDDGGSKKTENAAPNYWVFHAPYNKLVSKTFGRVIYHDFMANPCFYYDKYKNNEQMITFLKKYEKMDYTQTVDKREVIKGFEKLSKEYYAKYVLPSTLIPKHIGNCYTASIFMGLMSLICEKGNALMGKEIQMFSYGSGTVSSLYSLKVFDDKNAQKLLDKMVKNNDITKRFAERTKVPCNEFSKILNLKEVQFHGHVINDFVPQSVVSKQYFYANTYYLTKIDTKKQRFYELFDGKNEDKEILNEVKADIEHGNKEFIHLPNVAQFIGDKMVNSAQNLLKRAEDNGLSKKGAIKIDKIINSTQQTVTKCSYS